MAGPEQLKCPAGMGLVAKGGTIHANEPDYCIEITETSNEADNAFWKTRQKSNFTVNGGLKPAVSKTWEEARLSCQGRYPGGDLPTEKQWEKACGDKKFCTASGEELKKTEARYGESWKAGPVDVDSYPPNKNGLKNMTGNVWEWTLGDFWGYKILRGGSWDSYASWLLRADYRYVGIPDSHNANFGFRCAAPPFYFFLLFHLKLCYFAPILHH